MKYIVNGNPDFNKIPKQPGCYIFRNKFHHIIYIGKSKSLYNRIKQHFNNTEPTDYKHIELMSELYSIEVIQTETETNALILECQMIKRHKPKYNSQLKKGQVFPFIRVDLNQQYPTFTIADSKVKDGCEYFGSFYNRDDALATLELINSIWQTPTCCKESFNNINRPCLNYHLKKCRAPCGGEINAVDYCQTVKEVVKCLNGNFRFTVSRLKTDMEAASKKMDFERAARLRNYILGLNKLKKKQKSLYTDLDNKDIFLFFRAFGEKCFSIFFIRNGITLNRADFTNIQCPDKEKLAAFISENNHGLYTAENGMFLTVCLLEIGARKLFVPVSRRTNSIKTMIKLENAFREFIE